MIEFKALSKEEPYTLFKKKYDEAEENKQRGINIISISSYDSKKRQVDSRYVNLKFIENQSFIFFTNYNSPKSIAFQSHNQISALIYWHSTNTQIRMRAEIIKTSRKYNLEYFKYRSKEKNALAISSNQSNPIESYNQVKENFDKSLKNDDLKKCPKYWGGFAFMPYEIEFWEGTDFRLNKRNLYKKEHNKWNQYTLEP